MSPVRLNGSTSGYSELSAPAVAGNNSIALPTSNGSAYQMLRNGATAGSLEFADNITSGTAVASTSGTSIDFTSIPSWVKRITVMFNGVSTNGNSIPQIQIGAGSVVTTGYLSSAAIVGVSMAGQSSTTGFALDGASAANVIRSGIIVLCLQTGTTWVASGNLNRDDAGGYVNVIAGIKSSLGGTLDRVRITTVNGTDTFDAGSINILYE
jgi:hypothetical protein